MLEEYTQKHQANKTQLSATVASQVDAARAGMELLDSAQKTLAKMQECYKVCLRRGSIIAVVTFTTSKGIHLVIQPFGHSDPHVRDHLL